MAKKAASNNAPGESRNPAARDSADAAVESTELGAEILGALGEDAESLNDGAGGDDEAAAGDDQETTARKATARHDDAAADDAGEDPAAGAKGDDDDEGRDAGDGEASDDDEASDESVASEEEDEAGESDDASAKEDDDGTGDDDQKGGAEDEDDSAAGASGKWPKDTPQWARDEITELRAKNREARERLKELETRATGAASPTSESPLLEAQDGMELSRLEVQYSDSLDWAETTLEDMSAENWPHRDAEGNPIAKAGDKVYTKAQVQNVARMARRILREAPAARTLIEQRTQIAAAARAEHPWIEAPKSEVEKRKRDTFVTALKQLPGLRHVPYADMLVADAIEGKLMREARAKARAKAPEPTRKVQGAESRVQSRSEKPRAGAPAPAARSSAPQPRQQAQRHAAARERLVDEGSVEALTGFVENMLDKRAS